MTCGQQGSLLGVLLPLLPGSIEASLRGPNWLISICLFPTYALDHKLRGVSKNRPVMATHWVCLLRGEEHSSFQMQESKLWGETALSAVQPRIIGGTVLQQYGMDYATFGSRYALFLGGEFSPIFEAACKWETIPTFRQVFFIIIILARLFIPDTWFLFIYVKVLLGDAAAQRLRC